MTEKTENLRAAAHFSRLTWIQRYSRYFWNIEHGWEGMLSWQKVERFVNILYTCCKSSKTSYFSVRSANNKVPLIFINMESRFNRTFENVEMYLVLSCTSYADVCIIMLQAVDTSIRLNIPMLLLVCNQYDTSEYAKFKKLLEDYEIGHLLVWKQHYFRISHF